MEDKEKFTLASSVGIIYRTMNLCQLFLTVKDPGYPRKYFVGMGCLIGGNWVGEAGKGDKSPRDTFSREVNEELSFSGQEIDINEVKALFGIETIETVKRSKVSPNKGDERCLKFLRDMISSMARPYGAFRQTIPQEVLQRAEPDYNKGDTKGLMCVFTVGLSEATWEFLERLQKKFGNLSNESISIIISLQEMLRTGFKISWGQDQVVKRFFLEKGFPEAAGLTIIEGITSEPLEEELASLSYEELCQKFEILKTPFKA